MLVPTSQRVIGKINTSKITEYEELPAAARSYITRIEDLCGAPVSVISTGPERTETIIREGSPVSEWMR